MNQVDLSAFAARGGKPLIAHGTSDHLVSTVFNAASFRCVKP